MHLQRRYLWSTYCILGQKTCLSFRVPLLAEDKQKAERSHSKSCEVKTSKQDHAGLERKMEREGSLEKEKLSDVPGCKRNLILQVMTSSWMCPAQNPGVSNPGCWLFFPLKDFSVLNWLLPSSPRSTSKRRRLTDYLEFPSAQISLLFS